MVAPATTPTTRDNVVWAPQPGPQTALLACPVEDVLFGGARGGGKTDGLLGDWIAHQDEFGEYARGVIFRRTYPELEEIEERSRQLFPSLGASWVGPPKRTWTFRRGGRLRFRHMDRDRDADKYQGHSYTWIGWDELTNWPSPAPIDKLRATLRSGAGVPTYMRATTNPGGPGHNWVKARYIDPAPPFRVHRDEIGTARVFIPSRLADNRILVENDPDYWRRVEASVAGNEALLKAWAEGDWNIVAGGMFDDIWRPRRHVLPRFDVPRDWTIFRAFDWGSAAPYSVGWWALSSGSEARLPDGSTFRPPPESFVRIAELYGWDGKNPNRGLRETDTVIGRKIVEREKSLGIRERVVPGPADPSIFSSDPGVPTTADELAGQGAEFTRADASPGSIKNGCEIMRRLLVESGSERPEGPGLFVFETCRQWLRTVPILPRSDRKPEQYDTTAEDHAADETRYAVTSFRPGSIDATSSPVGF